MNKVGVLDIQGAVEEHVRALARCGVSAVAVKRAEDVRDLDGLIIPGGESTVIGMLMRRFGLWEAVLARAGEGMAIWGTCAGAILLAREVRGAQRVETLGLLNIAVERNAYGRQRDSFETEVECEFVPGEFVRVSGVFIRAPKICEVVPGDKVRVLARHGNEIVAVRQDRLLATTFHPELSEALELHRFFLGLL